MEIALLIGLLFYTKTVWVFFGWILQPILAMLSVCLSFRVFPDLGSQYRSIFKVILGVLRAGQAERFVS